jgi:hypothetical protein
VVAALSKCHLSFYSNTFSRGECRSHSVQFGDRARNLEKQNSKQISLKPMSISRDARAWFGFFVLYILWREEEEEPNIGPIFGREYSKQ